MVATEDGDEIPSSKGQIPNESQIPSFKRRRIPSCADIVQLTIVFVWNLELIRCLELGIWSLELLVASYCGTHVKQWPLSRISVTRPTLDQLFCELLGMSPSWMQVTLPQSTHTKCGWWPSG